MKDIGNALTMIMQDEKCTSIRALFLLSELNEGDENGLCKLQSKSGSQTRRRLRDTSHFQSAK